MNILQGSEPRLGEGEELPTKPVYWLIWVLDEEGKPYHSRMSNDKLLTPREASMQAYGIPPTERMIFFNMTSRVTDMRKKLRAVANFWTTITTKRGP